MRDIKYEAALRAMAEYQTTYRPALELHKEIFNFSTHLISNDDGSYAFSVRCWLEDPDSLSPRAKKGIEELVSGLDFFFEGVSYTRVVTFTRIPHSFQE